MCGGEGRERERLWRVYMCRCVGDCVCLWEGDRERERERERERACVCTVEEIQMMGPLKDVSPLEYFSICSILFLSCLYSFYASFFGSILLFLSHIFLLFSWDYTMGLYAFQCSNIKPAYVEIKGGSHCPIVAHYRERVKQLQLWVRFKKGELERVEERERAFLCASEWMGIEPHWKLHGKNTGYTNTIIVYNTDKSGRERKNKGRKGEREKRKIFLFTLFSYRTHCGVCHSVFGLFSRRH